ncbi:hypothetical protein IVB34_12330 [Bradyrhizobium sp. 2]|nr:helix-turn-helix domain-containing protein [Bradyrhizobium sp. 2]MCK1459142.1 hypothetical protein [Bradyrhizobium sp. 2]
MSRPLEENIDYHAINRASSDAFLARLVRFHNEKPKRGEPVPPDFDDDDLAPRTMMVRRIQQLVCREFKITMKDLLALSRVPALALPRQVAYYLAKENTMLTLPGIGRKFNRDHSTVYHGVG